MEAFTKRFKQNLSKEGYRFTFFCDLCGSGYVTPPRNPGKGETVAGMFGKAQAEAKLHFNRCPLCLRWVCDSDYVINLGICMDCKEKKR